MRADGRLQLGQLSVSGLEPTLTWGSLFITYLEADAKCDAPAHSSSTFSSVCLLYLQDSKHFIMWIWSCSICICVATLTVHFAIIWIQAVLLYPFLKDGDLVNNWMLFETSSSKKASTFVYFLKNMIGLSGSTVVPLC